MTTPIFPEIDMSGITPMSFTNGQVHTVFGIITAIS
jgi:hypothetical protein